MQAERYFGLIGQIFAGFSRCIVATLFRYTQPEESMSRRTPGIHNSSLIDWHSRKALAHRLSNTLNAALCVEATEEAIARYGAPEVFNTDQGA